MLRIDAGSSLERIRLGPRQHPAAVAFDEAAGVAQVADDVGHEQRAALGLRVDQLRERRREAVLRKHHREVALDVAPLEEPERDLFERTVRAQLVADGEERMLRERHVGGPVGREHEQRIWSNRPAR